MTKPKNETIQRSMSRYHRPKAATAPSGTCPPTPVVTPKHVETWVMEERPQNGRVDYDSLGNVSSIEELDGYYPNDGVVADDRLDTPGQRLGGQMQRRSYGSVVSPRGHRSREQYQNMEKVPETNEEAIARTKLEDLERLEKSLEAAVQRPVTRGRAQTTVKKESWFSRFRSKTRISPPSTTAASPVIAPAQTKPDIISEPKEAFIVRPRHSSSNPPRQSTSQVRQPRRRATDQSTTQPPSAHTNQNLAYTGAHGHHYTTSQPRQQSLPRPLGPPNDLIFRVSSPQNYDPDLPSPYGTEQVSPPQPRVLPFQQTRGQPPPMIDTQMNQPIGHGYMMGPGRQVIPATAPIPQTAFSPIMQQGGQEVFSQGGLLGRSYSQRKHSLKDKKEGNPDFHAGAFIGGGLVNQIASPIVGQGMASLGTGQHGIVGAGEVGRAARGGLVNDAGVVWEGAKARRPTTSGGNSAHNSPYNSPVDVRPAMDASRPRNHSNQSPYMSPIDNLPPSNNANPWARPSMDHGGDDYSRRQSMAGRPGNVGDGRRPSLAYSRPGTANVSRSNSRPGTRPGTGNSNIPPVPDFSLLLNKPLVDMTPKFKEAPQWSREGKGRGVRAPEGTKLVDVAGNNWEPENKPFDPSEFRRDA